MSARNRAIWSVVVIVFACALAFASVLAVWMRSLVLDTDAYVRAVGPLIEQPALRGELSVKIVDELYSRVDVSQLLLDSLPKRADVLAPTLAQGIHDTAIQLAAAALKTAAVRRVWEEANRVAHDQVVHVLEGKEAVFTTDNGEVAVDLRPVAGEVQRALGDHGVHLFDKVDSSTLDRRFVLFRSADLARAQRATRALDALGTWLPVVTVLAFAGGILLSVHRRAALGRAALAFAATMVVLLVVVAVGRSLYLDRVGTGISRAAAAAPFDALVRSLRFWVRTLFALAVLVWFATWFAGSREMIAREHDVRVALGQVARTHGRALAAGGLAVFALLLVTWDRPSPRTIVVLLGAVALWELTVAALARGPAAGDSA